MQRNVDFEYDWLMEQLQDAVDEEVRTGSPSTLSSTIKTRIQILLRGAMQANASADVRDGRETGHPGQSAQ